MKKLEEEADIYAKEMWGVYFGDKHPDVAITKTQGEISIQDFIAGVNSNWVKAEKIKSQIEVLDWIYHNDTSEESINKVMNRLKNKLKEHEQ